MILQNKFVWILQSKPKKKPNINPKQIPNGPIQTYSQKKKKQNKKTNNNQNLIRIRIRLNHQMVKLKQNLKSETLKKKT